MAPNGPSEPLQADEAERETARHAPAPAILVVDDDPTVLGLVELVLRRAGADVTTLAGGRAALRAIADGTCRPELLLTDIDMPEMSGIELAARVSALRPGIRVVMMTGDPVSAAAARDRPDLVATVLVKPVTSDELLRATGLAGTAVGP